MSYRMELNKNIVKKFNSFLRIGNPDSPSKTKVTQYTFLLRFIVNNTVMTLYDYQLCSTYIAKEMGVTPATVRKWIVELQKAGIIICVNPNYNPKHRSKAYRFTDFGLEIVNEFNGYSEKCKKSEKKKEYRTKKWAAFDKYTYDFKQCVFVCSSYLGCPESLVKDMKKNMALELLEVPRQNNINESRFLDFYYSYNHAIKIHNDMGRNYKKVDKKAFRKLVKRYFGQVELDFNLSVLQEYSDNVCAAIGFKMSHLRELLKIATKTQPKINKKLRRTYKALRKLRVMRTYNQEESRGFFVNYDTVIDHSGVVA